MNLNVVPLYTYFIT